jgi:uncharacterized protein YcfJ
MASRPSPLDQCHPQHLTIALDRQERNHRPEIVQFVRTQLAEKLHLEEPIVVESAAMAMLLDSPVTGTIDHDEWEQWRSRFIATESMLELQLLLQREILVAERVVRLLEGVSADLKAEVDRRKADLERERIELRKSSVKAIECVADELFTIGKSDIESQARSLQQLTASAKSLFHSNATFAIDALVNASEWKFYSEYDVQKPRVRECVETEAKYYLAQVNKELEKLRKACEAACHRFMESFEQRYRVLKAIGVHVVLPTIKVSDLTAPQVCFSAPECFIEDVRRDDSAKHKWGVILGAVGGFCVAGPVGAAFGALAGRGVATAAGMDQDEFHRNVRSRLHDDVTNFVDQYCNVVTLRATIAAASAIRELKKVSDQHILQYERAVNGAIVKCCGWH